MTKNKKWNISLFKLYKVEAADHQINWPVYFVDKKFQFLGNNSFTLKTITVWPRFVNSFMCLFPARGLKHFKLVLSVPVSWISFNPFQKRSWSLLLLNLYLYTPFLFSLLFHLCFKKTMNFNHTSLCCCDFTVAVKCLNLHILVVNPLSMYVVDDVQDEAWYSHC